MSRATEYLDLLFEGKVSADKEKKTLKCDMEKACDSPVSYIDEKGWIYCEPHGKQRGSSQKCRKLTKAEIKQLEDGKSIDY